MSTVFLVPGTGLGPLLSLILPVSAFFNVPLFAS